MEVSEAGNGCSLSVSPLLSCPCVDPRHIKARRPRRPTILPPSCLSSQHPPLPRSSRSSPRLSDFLTRSSRLGPHLSVSLDSLGIMQPLHRAASVLDSLVIATLRWIATGFPQMVPIRLTSDHQYLIPTLYIECFLSSLLSLCLCYGRKAVPMPLSPLCLYKTVSSWHLPTAASSIA
jgi:hypothetical protein